MHLDGNFGLALLIDQKFDDVFDAFFDEDGRLDFASAMANRTLFERVDSGDGAQPLAGDLHQPELAERQYSMTGAVAGHQFVHPFVEERAVGGNGNGS